MALKLVKSGKNFKVFVDQAGVKNILIENVRCSFTAVGRMKEDEGEDGNVSKKYKCTPMLTKTDINKYGSHVEAKNAFVEIMNELMAANDVKIPPEYRCIKNGDDTEREEYQGHWIISASDGKHRPIARNRAGSLILDPEKVKGGEEMDALLSRIDEIFFGGVTANVLLRPWFFNGTAKGKTKKYPKRICCGFMGIQHVENTPSFGQGRIDDTGVWGAVEGAEDDQDDGLGNTASNVEDDDPDGL